jgi:hypothetical protein
MNVPEKDGANIDKYFTQGGLNVLNKISAMLRMKKATKQMPRTNIQGFFCFRGGQEGQISNFRSGIYEVEAASQLHFIAPEAKKPYKAKAPNKHSGLFLLKGADWTGLEPATSAVTGQHSNQLNYQSFLISVQK